MIPKCKVCKRSLREPNKSGLCSNCWMKNRDKKRRLERFKTKSLQDRYDNLGKSKTFLLGVVLLTVLLLPVLCSGSLGSYKLSECINIKTILNSSYVNISTLSYPDSSLALTNQAMTKNGYTFNYSFCNTSVLGVYIYDYFDDAGNTYVNDFEITPSGKANISSGQGLTLLGSLIVIIIGGIAFFVLFFKAESLGFKTIWGALAVTDMIIAILFSMVLITQVVGGYDSLVTGFTTFWFVVQILIFIGFSAFILFAFYLAFMLWKFKRGHIN